MTDDNGFVPKLGQILDGAGIDMVIEAIKTRQQKWPDEDISLTVALVLRNIGARFDPLRCEGKEWRGMKKDILPGTGPPTCPNGHLLTKERGLTLGWVFDRE